MKKFLKPMGLLLAMLMLAATVCGCQTTPGADVGNDTPATTNEPATEPTAPGADAPVTEPVADDAWKYGGTYVGSIGYEPQWYYFCGSSNGVTILLGQLVGDHLVGYTADAQYEGRIAESWETSEDGLTWTFHLRNDVYWHDGVQLTAHDVEFSYNFIYDETLGVSHTGSLGGCVVKAVDDFTVTITLPAPNNLLLAYITGHSLSIIPEHIWKDITPAEVTNQSIETCMLGCGPFKFVEYVTGEYVHLQSNELYYGGQPYVTDWYLRILSDANARQNAFEAGELTVCPTSQTDFIESMEAKGSVFVKAPMGANNQLTINYIAHPEFNDTTWKRAFKMLIDSDTICSVVEKGFSEPYCGAFTPADTYFTEDIEQITYDVAAAQAIIESYGYAKNAEGYYEKDGEVLTYNAIYEIGYSDELMLFLQDSWKQAGVKLEIFGYDEDTFYSAEVNKNPYCHDWLFQVADNLFGPDSLYYYDQYCDPELIYFAAGHGYYNEEVNALFADALVATDEETVKADMIKAQQVLASDMAMFYIGYIYQSVLMGPNLCVDESGFRLWNQFYYSHPEKLYFTNN